MSEHEFLEDEDLDEIDGDFDDELDENGGIVDENDEFDDFDDDDEDDEEEALEEFEEIAIPMDMTKEEYVDYTVTMAKRFGALRTHKLSMGMFGIYTVVIGGSLIAYYAQFGVWDWMMAVLLGIVVLSACVILTIVPHRVKKNAAATYDAGNVGNYYGELILRRNEIVKRGLHGDVVIPFNEKTTYAEGTGFMTFTSMAALCGIMIPARCITPAFAEAVRKAVFAPSSRVRRQIFGRCVCGAATPIAKREIAPPPQVLHDVRVRYETEELKKILVDTGWKNYVASLPIIVTLGIMLGTVLALTEENLPVFFVALVGTVLALLVLSILSTRSKCKRLEMMDAGETTLVELTDYGVVIAKGGNDTPENRILTRWDCLTRAVERPDCVDITSVGRLIRIPKRCILDLDTFRDIVDAHYPPKS